NQHLLMFRFHLQQHNSGKHFRTQALTVQGLAWVFARKAL
ncbi:MAG: hypothetical protein ACI9EP_001201, partial [Oceanospirillaceae bacterium]